MPPLAKACARYPANLSAEKPMRYVRNDVLVSALTLSAFASAHAQGGGTMSHSEMMGGAARDSTVPAQPTRTGQEAFATIGEIVRILDANPATDWSKVNIEALRQHLMDMDDVTMRAEVRTESVDDGAAFDVRGTGRVRDAIRRMAMSHGATVTAADGFSRTAAESAEGAQVTIRATNPTDARMVGRFRALGFVGILTLGNHHTAHHLGIASGTMGAHHHH